MQSILATTLLRPTWLRVSTMRVHDQSAKVCSPDDHVPFSETLLLLDELGTGAELAIEVAQTKLFDLEAPLSWRTLHDDDGFIREALPKALPLYKEIYREGSTAAMYIQELPSLTSAFKRKPNGLVQQPVIRDRKSYRQLGLDALMLHLGANADGEKKPQQQLFLDQGKLRAARKRAIEALAQKGCDMRQFNPQLRGRGQQLDT